MQKRRKERCALMTDHLKATQSGMAMMNNMNKTDTKEKTK
jgi:hypothetical protein